MSRVPVGAAPACGGKPIGPADFGVGRFSVAAVLDRRAEQYPNRVMMSIGGVDVTFEQMRQRSCAAANALLDLGIGPGDCVALFAGTCPEWIYFWLGTGRIGAVAAAVARQKRQRTLEIADLFRCRGQCGLRIRRRHHEIGNARHDFRFEARSVEHAVMADALLHVMHPAMIRNRTA